MENSTPTPDQLEWAIEARAKNQLTTLVLYKVIDDSRELKRKNFTVRVQDLVGVSFSLWRAAFLADRTGKSVTKMAHAKEYLAKILTENSIAFAQDRGLREWSFTYYMDSARFRLQRLADRGYGDGRLSLMPPKGKRTAQQYWDCLHVAFAAAVKRLERDMTVAVLPAAKSSKRAK